MNSTTGLLQDIARDLQITIPQAGYLTSGYALGVVVSAPILTILLARFNRKNTLVFLIVLFIIGSIISAKAADFEQLMFDRILSAFCHGAFFGIGAVVATTVVAPNKKASAIALMFTGLTLANVVGVPLGTYFGQHFGWRAAFWAITALGVIGFIGLAALVPTILTLLTLLALILLLFTYTIHIKPLAIINVFFLGAIGFATIPPLQMYVMEKATGAPTLASAANISAFNLGASGGVWLGGLAIDAGYGFVSPNWVGAITTGIGLLIAIYAVRHKRDLVLENNG